MKTSLPVLLAIITTLTSGTKPEIIPQPDAWLLHERFHGKYKIITFTSNEAVDVNQEGQASIDLRQEIKDLASAELEIRIPAPNTPPGNNFLVYPALATAIYFTWKPQVVINYALQAVVRTFRFHSSLEEILLTPDSEQVDLNLFPLSQAVIIQSKEQISVIMEKLLYTSTGWKL